ncbi:50S ribosomal protein L36 [Bacillus sp. S34]|nr:50S ribosomal protein L36 [Bacillus sp. S34]
MPQRQPVRAAVGEPLGVDHARLGARRPDESGRPRDRRRGRVYVINKKNPRWNTRQG